MAREKGPRIQGKDRLRSVLPEQRVSLTNIGLAEVVEAHPKLSLAEISVKVDLAHRLAFPARHKVAPHLHPFFEFTYIEKGRVFYTLRERTFSVGPGQAFIMPPNNVHHWVSKSEPVTLFGMMCTVSPTRPARHTLGHRLDEGTGRMKHTLVTDPGLRASIEELCREAGQHRADYRKAAAMHLDLVLLKIFRAVREALPVAPVGPATGVGLPSQRLILAAKAYAEANLPSGVNVQDLARHLEISPRHVNRVFRETERRSAQGYLQELRLERAKRLLREGRFPVKAVAGMCGFRDLGYFSRCFRRGTGKAPSAYRSG